MNRLLEKIPGKPKKSGLRQESPPMKRTSKGKTSRSQVGAVDITTAHAVFGRPVTSTAIQEAPLFRVALLAFRGLNLRSVRLPESWRIADFQVVGQFGFPQEMKIGVSNDRPSTTTG
jgi:hypothetical protein